MSRCLLLLASWAALPVAAADGPDFSREVRPILARHCFACHGPAVQKGDLRLDQRDNALESKAIVPGKPAESQALARVRRPGKGHMPPPSHPSQPSPAEVETLARWLEAGADYKPHWAFAPPTRSPLPDGKAAHPIDRWIDAKLREANLQPSPLADRRTLIRRLSLDLVGLVPSPEEVTQFVEDKSSDAVEKLVDRLLGSKGFGERWGRHWLDAARYADSNGFTIDGNRSIWPYRDWVINALNADMPFTRFTTEQLAGDLFDSPSNDQLVATGFQRNTPLNEEGGVDPEQFRAERTVDRAATVGSAWLGLTVGCAQCHDHKFDPVSQKEFFGLYAFFNNCDEPVLHLGTVDQNRQISLLRASLKDAEIRKDPIAFKRLTDEVKKLEAKVPSSLILRQAEKTRPNFVHLRGDFLAQGDPVEPGAPAVLPPLAGRDSKPPTRLDLAKWLVRADHPLTARVQANRVWQHLFGTGLVETDNDFGLQGSPPSHPELLDLLAVEFAERGWSFKKLVRFIVTSEAYRRSSLFRADVAKVDSNNRLLARQNRLRLEAEALRDAALSASGLLVSKMGGPGVFPPQAGDLTAFTQTKHAWPESKGDDRYRRGIYTFVRRQSPHPLAATFDGPEGSASCTKRSRSNTPLQALHLANDPAFVEFADGFAKRVLRDGPADITGRIKLIYQRALCRAPTSQESVRLTQYVGALAAEPEQERWKAVARVVLNLDEFVTRE